MLDAAALALIETEVSDQAERAFAFADASPYPPIEETLRDVVG